MALQEIALLLKALVVKCEEQFKATFSNNLQSIPEFGAVQFLQQGRSQALKEAFKYSKNISIAAMNKQYD